MSPSRLSSLSTSTLPLIANKGKAKETVHLDLSSRPELYTCDSTYSTTSTGSSSSSSSSSSSDSATSSASSSSSLLLRSTYTPRRRSSISQEDEIPSPYCDCKCTCSVDGGGRGPLLRRSTGQFRAALFEDGEDDWEYEAETEGSTTSPLSSSSSSSSTTAVTPSSTSSKRSSTSTSPPSQRRRRSLERVTQEMDTAHPLALSLSHSGQPRAAPQPFSITRQEEQEKQLAPISSLHSRSQSSSRSTSRKRRQTGSRSTSTSRSRSSSSHAYHPHREEDDNEEDEGDDEDENSTTTGDNAASSSSSSSSTSTITTMRMCMSRKNRRGMTGHGTPSSSSTSTKKRWSKFIHTLTRYYPAYPDLEVGSVEPPAEHQEDHEESFTAIPITPASSLNTEAWSGSRSRVTSSSLSPSLIFMQHDNDADDDDDLATHVVPPSTVQLSTILSCPPTPPRRTAELPGLELQLGLGVPELRRESKLLISSSPLPSLAEADEHIESIDFDDVSDAPSVLDTEDGEEDARGRARRRARRPEIRCRIVINSDLYLITSLEKTMMLNKKIRGPLKDRAFRGCRQFYETRPSKLRCEL